MANEKGSEKPRKKEKPVKLDRNGNPKLPLGARAKALFGELKNVTWPTFPKVMKQLGVVLTVTVIFLVLIFGMDMGLQALYKLLTQGIESTSSSAALPLVSGALQSVGLPPLL